MSTMIAPPRNEAAGRRVGGARLVVPDVSWCVYETWVDLLPESTPVRMAYDGRDLEIMTKGPDHKDYRQLLGHPVAEQIARSLRRTAEGVWARRPGSDRRSRAGSRPTRVTISAQKS